MLIGEILTELGHASRDQVDAALALQRRQGGFVGAILMAFGAISADQLAAALRLQRELSADEEYVATAAAG
jgi:uncharacterized protein (DUF433 family)